MGPIEVWRSGQEIMVSALRLAADGKSPDGRFEMIDAIESELERMFLASVPFQRRTMVNTNVWTPWRAGEGLWIRSGADLVRACDWFMPPSEYEPNWVMIKSYGLQSEKWLMGLIEAADPVLTVDEVAILDEMLKMGATNSSLRSAKSILGNLRWTTEGKRAFDRLKRYGYVIGVAKPGGGYYLTEAGIDRAKRLR